ncbi:MAG TPA: class I SAM-dependent methyltransferase [Myxococcota bacterium]|jgi:SAM-dependent methyltransferase|nr:class I SAM-dependent methyltransferase [Myxococcota bacterium]
MERSGSTARPGGEAVPAREPDRAHWLELLRRNVGFDAPEAWVDYARAHHFERIAAEPLRACPSCGQAASREIGQYVYYSTLFRLRRCAGCGLAYADARLDPEVVRGHFESAYKDDAYFCERRAAIFAHLAGLIDARARRGARVLDVGGAKGHLLDAVRRRRPDLALVLNDLSEAACEAASREFGLRTICGGLATLEALGESFDVVVMSDVLYYEPDLPAVWRLLPRLVAPGGSVLIRVPNRLAWIRVAEGLRRAWRRVGGGRATRIRFYNPEHLYSFSRGFLLERLRAIGFTDVRAWPSPLLSRGPSDLRVRTLHLAASWIHRATGRVVSPAMVVEGRRPEA